MSCERALGWTLARHRGGVLEGPAPARRLEDRGLVLVTERLRSTGDAADKAEQGWSPAAYRAFEREALAGFSAVGL